MSINSSHRQYQPGRKTSVMHKGDLWLRKILLIGMIILLIPVSSVADNLSCRRLPLLTGRFLDNHYAQNKMTSEIQGQAVSQMIKIIDPSKTLLYESDLEKLSPILQNLFTRLQSGDCASLQQIYDLLVFRSRENEEMVKKILGSGYQLDDTVELNINVKKRPYVKTAAEKYDLLRKIVQFQIENSLRTGVNLEEAIKQQIHRYELQTMRVVERNPEKLIASVAESFALALDPHTSYLSPENLEDIRIQMQLSLEGIGTTLSSENGFTVIEELIPGGGAERSGQLKPKDKIIAVAQEGKKPVDVIDMDLPDVIKMIRGRKGTQVTLTILRQDEATVRFDVTIMRDRINIKEQEARISYETRSTENRQYRFAIIDLPSFYGDEKENKSCYEDVKRLLAEARRKQVDGIVLDLSRNGGGLLTEAVRVAGLFLHEGAVVATKDNRGQVTILANGSAGGKKGDRRKVVTFPLEEPIAAYTGPLLVLTSRLSASASEIVAGALRDYRRAVIVGQDHTFGKGSVQVLMPLPWDMGGMKVTTALYFLPGGQSTQKTGVAADIRLPAFSLLENIGETELDYPLPAQFIEPFLSRPDKTPPSWKTPEPSLLADLAVKSASRIAKDVKFAEIIRKNKEAVERKGIIRLADLRREIAKEEGGRKKETPAELKKKARDQYAPYVNESVNILLDLVLK